MKAPNILILMADQMAPHYTGTYGNPLVKTPNMNRVAELGCRFDAAYTPYPLCAPARFSLLSASASIENQGLRQRRQNSLRLFRHSPTILSAWATTPASPEEMHFVGPDQLHGFSERLTTEIYPADFAFTPNWEFADERIDTWYHNMSSVHEAGSAAVTFQLEYDDEVGFHSIRKLYDYARDPESTPFMMVASFTHPHDPYVARHKWWDLYSDVDIDLPHLDVDSTPVDPHSQRILAGIQADSHRPSESSILNARRAYYANVSYFDDWVGQFMEVLDMTQMRDHTIVVILADHGDMLGRTGPVVQDEFFRAISEGAVHRCRSGHTKRCHTQHLLDSRLVADFA